MTPQQQAEVLNACRRHGSVHIANACVVLTTHGAQRLSASWIGSLGATPTFPASSAGAQRLSASWIGSQQGLFDLHEEQPVLNACRRHGSVHFADQPPYLQLCLVLNACRRHGSVHRKRWVLCTSR